MGTSVERASAVEEMRQKAEGYEMPNSRVNGMNVLEVRRAAEETLSYIRENGTPYFLEVWKHLQIRVVPDRPLAVLYFKMPTQ